MIFVDVTGRRRRWMLFASFLAGMFLLVVALLFALSLWRRPVLHVPPVLANAPIPDLVQEAAAPLDFDALKSARRPRFHDALPQLPPRLWRTAFVQQESDVSLLDLQHHLHHLDALFPNVFAWTSPTTGLEQSLQPALLRLARSSNALLVPLISNADSAGHWHGKEVGALLHDPVGRQALLAALLDASIKNNFDGINIDFEALAPESRNDFSSWLHALAAAFHGRNLLVTVDVPLDDPAYDYASIATDADAVIAMAYDQHYAESAPGAIAGTDWFESSLQKLLPLIPRDKFIVGIGAYGYDWDTTSPGPAQSISFAQAMALADQADAHPESDNATGNPDFRFIEGDGDTHEIWFLDAVTAWNQFLELQDKSLAGFALYRLGTEDPAVWKFLDNPEKQISPELLKPVPARDQLLVAGDGEIYRVLNTPADGMRDLSLAGRVINYAIYKRLPHYLTVEKRGAADARKIAITFDDGPDPRWTPEILAILRQYNVKATFFLVGNRAQQFPQIVQAEFRDGHLLGNHTFFHPELPNVSQRRLDLELDATQRVIESLTGHQTLLFRSPFDTDTTPSSAAEYMPFQHVTDRGYYLVGSNIDSRDWLSPATPVILNSVLSCLHEKAGNIVTFHDFGADRRPTLAALRTLIPELQSQGYQFVTVNDLLSVPASACMPQAPAGDRPFIIGGEILATLRRFALPLVGTLMLIASVLAIARVTFLTALVAQVFFRRKRELPPFQPPVAVVIPAYNEAKVIERTIRSVLAGNYPQLRIIVVDDGSSDGTPDIVASLAASDSRIQLLRKPNGGKFSALNLAFKTAREDYLVTIDADTLILPATIHHLLAPFADSSVDAVCGNVQVGNIRNLLTAFQDVEYVITQNYDRQALESLNCITVVPGATGAWRREAVLAVGGYSADTLTEDADLTITLLAHGHRIVYAPLAKSITEAPENARDLFKQRFRWSYGMIQCLWKHRRSFGRGLLGWLALPNILLQILTCQFTGPLGDALLLCALFSGHLGVIAGSYLLFLAIDLLGALVAFRLDRRKFRTLWVLPLQRFLYRPLLYCVYTKSFIAALAGRPHGWNKLARTGALSMFPLAAGKGPVEVSPPGRTECLPTPI